MEKSPLPVADRKTLTISPTQLREQQIVQFKRIAGYFRGGFFTSLAIGATCVPSGILLLSYPLMICGGIGLLNVPYMHLRRKSTLRKLEKLRAQHAAHIHAH